MSEQDIKLTHIALHIPAGTLEENVAFYERIGFRDNSPLDSQKSPWLATAGQDNKFSLVLVPFSKDEYSQKPSNITRMGICMPDDEGVRDLYKYANENNLVAAPYERNAQMTRSTFMMRAPSNHLVEIWSGASNKPEAPRFSNFSMHVTDMEASREFFETWTNMETKGYGNVKLGCRLVSPEREDVFELVLCADAIESYDQAGSDISHLGFAVRDESVLTKIYEKAQQAGIVDIEMRTMKPPAGTLFFTRDPDGYRVEFSHGQPLGKFKQPQESEPQEGLSLE